MENRFFLFIVNVLARMLGMTSDEVIKWMISMINNMFPPFDHISQVLEVWGISCYNLLDPSRKEVYIGNASSLTERQTYKVRWAPGITTILQNTFTGRPPIEELIIPETVTRIEDGAFSDLMVSRITFPGRLKSIPSFACSSCYQLKQVEIPDSVEKIEFGAFLCCRNLSEIKIPESVITIEKSAFEGCDALPDDVKEHIRFIGGPEALGEPKLTETKNKDDSNE